MVLVGERLADDHGIRIAQFGEYLRPGAAGEKIGVLSERSTLRSAEASVAGMFS